MSDTLQRILVSRRRAVATAARAHPLAEMEQRAAAVGPVRGFAHALRTRRAAGGLALIAEIKRASPSAGLIRRDFDPAALARAYARGGATCLSVLTEPDWFEGDPAHLRAARAACALPVLRKDFIVDPWQIVEARAMGADAILLIMAALDADTAAALETVANAHGLDVLAEAHDAAEVEAALRLKTPLIGINNRDLATLAVDPRRALDLAALVPPDRLVVAESGLRSHADLARYADAGVGCFLVGEALMAAGDVAAATRAMLGT